jgi:hypothetical protein
MQRFSALIEVFMVRERATRTIKSSGESQVFLKLTGVPPELVEGVRDVSQQEKSRGRKGKLSDIYAQSLIEFMNAVEAGETFTLRAQVPQEPVGAGKIVAFWCREDIAHRFTEFHDSRRIANMSVLLIAALERFLAKWKPGPSDSKRTRRSKESNQ